MPEKEYILFCDESDRHGKYYSNFYGGVMVGASQYQRITDRLNAQKAALNFYGEVKWEKVTEMSGYRFRRNVLPIERQTQGKTRWKPAAWQADDCKRKAL